jgi:hypothetical protein
MTATHDTAAEGGLSRRSVLGIALTGSLNGLFGTAASAHGAARTAAYGPLIADPNGLLALPEGFTYTIVAQAGVTEAALRVHAGRPGLGPGRARQHHRLGTRRADHRRGRRGGLAPGGLFANIQRPGYVLAIQGPWRKQR